MKAVSRLLAISLAIVWDIPDKDYLRDNSLLYSHYKEALTVKDPVKRRVWL